MSEGVKESKLKKHILIGGAILGALLMILARFVPESKEEEVEVKESDITYYTERIEKKLEDLISSAQGVGKATVVVTLDSQEEFVFAQNTSENGTQKASEYVIISSKDGEEPVLISEIYPKVRGVAVVCTGGKSTEVKNRVTELIAAALGISVNKIAVSG